MPGYARSDVVCLPTVPEGYVEVSIDRAESENATVVVLIGFIDGIRIFSDDTSTRFGLSDRPNSDMWFVQPIPGSL